MLDSVLHLIGMTLEDFNLDDNLLFCVCSLLVLFCVGYMFNFFQTLMERLTAKRGR